MHNEHNNPLIPRYLAYVHCNKRGRVTVIIKEKQKEWTSSHVVCSSYFCGKQGQDITCEAAANIRSAKVAVVWSPTVVIVAAAAMTLLADDTNDEDGPPIS